MRTSRPRYGARSGLAGLAALAACALAACAVVESSRMALEAPLPGSPCVSTLGSYSLPKANIRIRVGQKDKAPPDLIVSEAGKSPITVVRHPDPALAFCLDHLSSAFARDKITIEKWPRGGDLDEKRSFLGAVAVKATDQTTFIVRSLLRALFILISGSSSFGTQRDIAISEAPQLLAELEYDPFNPHESAVVNARLTRLGFCLVLEHYTFNTYDVSIDQYCGAPERYGPQPMLIAKAYLKAQATPADPRIPGLLYRPRIPYRLAIYRKKDPGGRGPWQLNRMETVELENLSPVLSLAIERAVFGGRNANFIFYEGTLLTACVAKTSEIAGFVDIPLEIARSIVELPATIISVRIDQTKWQKELIEAQHNLFQVQKAYLDALASGQFDAPSGTPASAQKPSALPSIVTPPGDIRPLDGAPAYGTFIRNLDTLCGEGS